MSAFDHYSLFNNAVFLCLPRCMIFEHFHPATRHNFAVFENECRRKLQHKLLYIMAYFLDNTVASDIELTLEKHQQLWADCRVPRDDLCSNNWYPLTYTVHAKICLLSSCLEALLWCIKARPQSTILILSDELLSDSPLLSLALTILHVAGWNWGWLGMYCPCSVREMGDWYGLKIRFRICLWFFFSAVNFLLLSPFCDLGFTGFSLPRPAPEHSH